jgi:hypothetical protein
MARQGGAGALGACPHKKMQTSSPALPLIKGKGEKVSILITKIYILT